MKRLLLVSALALACLTACTSGEKPGDRTAAPQAADAALSQDTKAICDQAGRTSDAFGNTLNADLKLQLEAKDKGAAATAEAKQKLRQDVSNYAYALGDMSRLAGDATLKTTLKQMSDRIAVFKGDLSKDDAAKLSELSDTLENACGKR